jgi:hypothetical protein
MGNQILSEEFIRFQKLAGIPLTEAVEKSKLSDEDIASLEAIGQNMQDIRKEAELKISQLEKQREEMKSELADKYLGTYEGPGEPLHFEPFIDYSSKTIEWRRRQSDYDRYYASMRG